MEKKQLSFEFTQPAVIKGFPELRWTGKRPYRSTEYYPAQLKERYGKEQNGWINKIFWGDNLQVISHLLAEYRGKINLIYIDPPFDSKADYKKKIELKSIGKAESDASAFEEKQYSDIWTNDEYLQFMYERLILLRELLSDTGSIYVHCDWHKSHYLRVLMDEVFGRNSFKNEVIWYYRRWNIAGTTFASNHDTLLFYTKSSSGHTFNQMYIPKSEKSSAQGKSWKSVIGKDGVRRSIQTDEPTKGVPMPDLWEISMINPVANERTEVGYPTQKPEALLERVIKASSNPGDIVFDCFMGSGTTQAVAMKLGRRFIGADINLGAVETTIKRLLTVADELQKNNQPQLCLINDKNADCVEQKYTSFEVYNVNNYDFFTKGKPETNRDKARELIIEALKIEEPPLGLRGIWDGVLDGRMVAIMPVDHIATKSDLEGLISKLPYSEYEKRKKENPLQPVEKITLVCMGHEPDLTAYLKEECRKYKFDIDPIIVDILLDKSNLLLKREAEAEVIREGNKLIIRSFYPMNLLQKLSLEKEYVKDWRQLVESIMIDWHYDTVMKPDTIDFPGRKGLVSGTYDIPEDASTIKVKITDLISESLEVILK